MLFSVWKLPLTRPIIHRTEKPMYSSLGYIELGVLIWFFFSVAKAAAGAGGRISTAWWPKCRVVQRRGKPHTSGDACMCVCVWGGLLFSPSIANGDSVQPTVSQSGAQQTGCPGGLSDARVRVRRCWAQ